MRRFKADVKMFGFGERYLGCLFANGRVAAHNVLGGELTFFPSLEDFKVGAKGGDQCGSVRVEFIDEPA